MNYVTRDEDIRYVILLSHATNEKMSLELIRAHVNHLRSLDQEGKLVLCGPFTDYAGGMVIIRASSKEEAVQIAERDPYVLSGKENYELRTWELSLESNGHMGIIE
ncbi:YciI family protein [Saccharibacillus sp. CPCC 101409]|uniref:YciI family protein n=1 Tax=Saccharibacillus sp. CPCC 101409 TaxID=3058041 RepID=UPI002671CC41|nr:YciI family protein [Saccharibacillus sp. CPCC 101409]MDO3409724.1 YciI family protein [Saccharibacillus sp. CPCC 101409]